MSFKIRVKELVKAAAAVILAALFVASVVVPGFASAGSDTDKPVLEEIGPSPEYQNYLENPEKYEGGIVPAYFSFSSTQNKVKPGELPGAYRLNAALAQLFYDLPSVYDGRKEGYMTPVRNQGQDQTCVAFATLGVTESNLAKQAGEKYDFSEQHINLALARQYADGSVNYYGFNREAKDLHWAWYLEEYLMSGMGPVLESEMPYIYDSSYGAQEEINALRPQYKVTEIQTIPGDWRDPYNESLTQEQKDKYLETIKKYIMEYGSVTITMLYDSEFADNTMTYFYLPKLPSTDIPYTNHQVTVVGWDDTVSADKFRIKSSSMYYPGAVPAHDGGLIIKNSHGTDRNDDGYFYLSYDSINFAIQDSICITSIRPFDAENEHVVSYAEHGMTIGVGYSRFSGDAQYYGSMFYLGAGERVSLNEVDFYLMLGDMPYELYLSPEGSLDYRDFIKIDSGISEEPGYYSAQFENIVLGGDAPSQYLIVAKVFPGSYQYVIPIEKAVGTYEAMPVNFVNDYIEYTDNNGKRSVVRDVPENRSMITSQGYQYNSVNVSFTGYNYQDGTVYLTPYQNGNVVLSAITSAWTGTDEKESLKINSVTNDPVAVQGKECTVTAAASGGSGNYAYSFYVLGGGKIYASSVYGSLPAFNFTPKKAGTYTVAVYVDDSLGARVTEKIKVEVSKGSE